MTKNSIQQRDANYAERPDVAETRASVDVNLLDMISPPDPWQVAPPEIRLDDFVGMEEAKRIIHEQIIEPLQLSQRGNAFDDDPEFAVLLFGPSESANKTFARAIAGETETPLFIIGRSDVYLIVRNQTIDVRDRILKLCLYFLRFMSPTPSKVVFNVDLLIESIIIGSLLAEIKKNKTCAVLIEENGSPQQREIMQRLHDELDELKGQTEGQTGRLLLIGASCTPWALDKSVISRFKQAVYVPLPDKTARCEILRREFGDTSLSAEVDLDYIADKTKSFSGRDLRNLVWEIKEIAVSREENGSDVILMQDVKKGLESARPSTSPEWIQRYELWNRDKWSIGDDQRHMIGPQIPTAPAPESEQSVVDSELMFSVDPAPFEASPFFRV